jgi:hypothetical protein
MIRPPIRPFRHHIKEHLDEVNRFSNQQEHLDRILRFQEELDKIENIVRQIIPPKPTTEKPTEQHYLPNPALFMPSGVALALG